MKKQLLLRKQYYFISVYIIFPNIGRQYKMLILKMQTTYHADFDTLFLKIVQFASFVNQFCISELKLLIKT